VARRLGQINNPQPKDRQEAAEAAILGYVTHDTISVAEKMGAEVTLTSLFSKENMTASEHEVMDALREGITILDGVMPVEVVLGDDGRATGLKVAKCQMDGGRPVPVEGTEFRSSRPT
jgi:glutamate synthase (NADPH) small chain